LFSFVRQIKKTAGNKQQKRWYLKPKKIINPHFPNKDKEDVI
jgi:hypothetical protein